MTEVRHRADSAATSGLDLTWETINLPDSRTYDVWRTNTEKGGRPLLIYLGLGTTAMNGIGKIYLQEYSQAIDRPLFGLNLRREQHSSFDDHAKSDAEVLDVLDIEELDITGVSSGALLGSYTAGHAGPRVNTLISISSAGTMHGYMDYARALPNQFINGLKELSLLRKEAAHAPHIEAGSSDYFNIARYRELYKTVQLARLGSLATAVSRLATETTWRDVVGSDDHITDYRDHLALVRSRNESLPRSSSLSLLCGEAHMWISKRTLLARIVASHISNK